MFYETIITTACSPLLLLSLPLGRTDWNPLTSRSVHKIGVNEIFQEIVLYISGAIAPERQTTMQEKLSSSETFCNHYHILSQLVTFIQVFLENA